MRLPVPPKGAGSCVKSAISMMIAIIFIIKTATSVELALTTCAGPTALYVLFHSVIATPFYGKEIKTHQGYLICRRSHDGWLMTVMIKALGCLTLKPLLLTAVSHRLPALPQREPAPSQEFGARARLSPTCYVILGCTIRKGLLPVTEGVHTC